MSPPPEAFLFDVDGVLRVFAPDAVVKVERRHGLAEGTLASIAYAPERYGPALLGQISDEDWRMSVVAALTPICADAEKAIEIVLDWSEPLGRIEPEVAAALAGIRAQGLPVGLVANGTTRLMKDLFLLGLAPPDAVDTIVTSAWTGVAKPAAEIYATAAGMLSARPTHCVYVSADHSYVAGAERVGMKGHLFDGAEGLRAMLSQRLPAG